MITLDTIAGKMYVVMSPNGGTVTSADGLISEEVNAGKQTVVFGTGAALELSDDAGRIVETFKYAPVGLMGAGGGAETSPLPDDYIAAEFIQFDGTDFVQYNQAAVTSKAGDRLVFSTITQFYKNLGTTQSEGRYSTFYYGVEKGNFCYGVGSTVDSAAMEADTNWHKITLSHTPSLSFFRVDGAEFQATYNASAQVLQYGICIGTALDNVKNCYSRKKRATLQINGAIKFDLIPGITAAGKVVFYDVANGKSKASYSNKLRAGLTIPQARKLGKLPDGGGTIRVCLPKNYTEDEYVVAAMAEAEAKGWIFDTDWYEAGAAASTFALRRVLVRKTQDAEGNYVDAQGVRYFVEKTQEVIGAEPEALGYEAFRSVESAVAYWELEPYSYPEDELLTEQ